MTIRPADVAGTARDIIDALGGDEDLIEEFLSYFLWMLDGEPE